MNSSSLQNPDKEILAGLVSETEYAAQRGVSIRTCQRDRQLRQSPPFVRLGRRIFYRVEAIRQWLVKNEHAVDRMPVLLRTRPKPKIITGRHG